MGVSYMVEPFNAEAFDKPWLTEQLNDQQLRLPVDGVQGRYPTAREIRRVLDTLEGYRVEYRVEDGGDSTPWVARVEEVVGDETVLVAGFIVPRRGKYATIRMLEFDGDEDTSHWIYFEKGDPDLNLLILERLTHICGPQLVYTAESELLHLVIPGADVEALLQVL